MNESCLIETESEKTGGLEYCRSTLQHVSRSFALTIPMIDKELRDKITVSYIVARVLDTIEDSPIPMELKTAWMDEWIELISHERADRLTRAEAMEKIRRIAGKAPVYVADAAYSELMRNLSKVYSTAISFDNHFTSSQHRWFGEMKDGMKKYLTKRIMSFQEFDEYTYYVAGTVGGFLTDMVCQGSEEEQRKTILRETFRDFGHLLQKVNVIRDFRADTLEGRFFWPKEIFGAYSEADLLDKKNSAVALAALDRMVADAKAHVPSARKYIDNIPPCFSGYRMFAEVNFQMALKTLEAMEKNPEVFFSETPVKIRRAEVVRILATAAVQAHVPQMERTG